jgi:HPt (histidine-containing phosphotransfer) domain-containing protein
MKKDTESPNKKTPVIVLTANAISGARENFLREGFDDYLSKPIESEHLEKTLIQYLPKNKVILSRADVPEVKEKKTTSSEDYPVWLQDLDRIDIGEGLKNCGSVDSYVSIMKVFYESVPMTENNLTTAYEEKNFKDYTSYVHSLKSTSRTIGAQELSKLAEKLEEAGNAGDIATIDEYHDELMNLYSIVTYSLSKVPEIVGEAEKEEDEKPKEAITPSQMKDAYQTIIEVSKTLDYDTLTFILDSLKKYSLKDEDAKIMRRIGEMAYKLQWDEIGNLAGEGLKGVE